MAEPEWIELGLDELPGWASDLVAKLDASDVVLLEGALGAGKTTLVREILRALGYEGPVRSPTFNLIHQYETTPPIGHVDLYRLEDARTLDLEDLIGSVLLLIEWPDRLGELIDPQNCWRLSIEPSGEKRRYRVIAPIR
ncbi:MAG: tRNA threonylcarbamoyladenosine biosynthesis protein TsaE [Fimbriimonadaceae bacterium]|nr:tRNA threonylcarbamoyladenosine biosynthesis protein TsaE [Fimbriimonadaceae bacterium]